MVCTSFGDLVLELVVVLDLEVLSVGSKDELVTCHNLGLLGGLSHQRVLGVQGAGEGSGARFFLLQCKLLVLNSVRVHLHDNPLGLGADVLGAGDDCARVGEYRRQRSAFGVEFLRSGAYSHLVSLPLNVGLRDLESSISLDTIFYLS